MRRWIIDSAADDSDLDFLEQAQAMRELLPYLRSLVGDSAAVTAHDHWVTEPDGSVDRSRPPSIHSVRVRPHNPAALAVDLTCEQWIVVATETETGYQGCLSSLVPLPGWKRWGRTTQYEPYRSTVTD
jgi:hypothetical protein